MITLLVLFCVLLVLSFVVAVLMGIATVAPVLLIIICLPVIDYFGFKIIFGRKKKK